MHSVQDEAKATATPRALVCPGEHHEPPQAPSAHAGSTPRDSTHHQHRGRGSAEPPCLASERDTLAWVSSAEPAPIALCGEQTEELAPLGACLGLEQLDSARCRLPLLPPPRWVGGCARADSGDAGRVSPEEQGKQTQTQGIFLHRAAPAKE